MRDSEVEEDTVATLKARLLSPTQSLGRTVFRIDRESELEPYPTPEFVITVDHRANESRRKEDTAE